MFFIIEILFKLLKIKTKQKSSCWAFASIAALESAIFIKSGNTSSISLSEQQLVDCAYKRDGCNGGSMEIAFINLNKAGGSNLRSFYPVINNFYFEQEFYSN